MTPEEIKKLQDDLAAVTDKSAQLEKENAELKKLTSDKPAAPSATVLPTKKFTVDKVNYKFVVAKFNVPGFGELTAKEALTDEKVLAYLVKEKSGVIEEVA